MIKCELNKVNISEGIKSYIRKSLQFSGLFNKIEENLFSPNDMTSNYQEVVDVLNFSFKEDLLAPKEENYELIEPSNNLILNYLISPIEIIRADGSSDVVDSSNIITYSTDVGPIEYIRNEMGELEKITTPLSVTEFFYNILENQRNILGNLKNLLTLQNEMDLDDPKFIEYLKCKL